MNPYPAPPRGRGASCWPMSWPTHPGRFEAVTPTLPPRNWPPTSPASRRWPAAWSAWGRVWCIRATAAPRSASWPACCAKGDGCPALVVALVAGATTKGPRRAVATSAEKSADPQFCRSRQGRRCPQIRWQWTCRSAPHPAPRHRLNSQPIRRLPQPEGVGPFRESSPHGSGAGCARRCDEANPGKSRNWTAGRARGAAGCIDDLSSA